SQRDTRPHAADPPRSVRRLPASPLRAVPVAQDLAQAGKAVRAERLLARPPRAFGQRHDPSGRGDPDRYRGWADERAVRRARDLPARSPEFPLRGSAPRRAGKGPRRAEGDRRPRLWLDVAASPTFG